MLSVDSTRQWSPGVRTPEIALAASDGGDASLGGCHVSTECAHGSAGEVTGHGQAKRRRRSRRGVDVDLHVGPPPSVCRARIVGSDHEAHGCWDGTLDPPSGSGQMN